MDHRQASAGACLALYLFKSTRPLYEDYRVAASHQHLEVKSVSCTCRGCILETVDVKVHPEAAWSMPVFAAQRSTKPCTVGASKAILSQEIMDVVLSILDKQACIFNEQVRAVQLAMT